LPRERKLDSGLPAPRFAPEPPVFQEAWATLIEFVKESPFEIRTRFTPWIIFRHPPELWQMIMTHEQELGGVYAVPPLARTADRRRAIAFEENVKIVNYIIRGGITRLIYGGNAFFHHLTLAEYEQVLDWLSQLQHDGLQVIVAAGPSFGRLMDQATLLRRAGVHSVMVLPCGDPRDAAGIGRGLREFADASGAHILAYVKEETNLGIDSERGLDVLGKLVDEGVCDGVKYAVVRDDPRVDAYLEALLRRVDQSKVISGIGERPAVTHLRQWKLTGFTTGSGCLAPQQSVAILRSCERGDFATAEEIRERFLGLEDMRDLWGPARVLHHAMELTGIARTGAIPPFVSPLSAECQEAVRPVAQHLADERYGGSGGPQTKPKQELSQF
jgi:dihydrodipicolinate synthase/N-acetylneuraminate lyase